MNAHRSFIAFFCCAALAACGSERPTVPNSRSTSTPGRTEFQVRPYFSAGGVMASRSPNDDPRLAKLRAVVARGIPAMALATSQELGQAVVVVIRDPGAREARLIVLNQDYLNEEVALTAEGILRTDEMEVPNPVGVRKITVYGDRKMRLDAGAAPQWRLLTATASNVVGTSRRDGILTLKAAGHPYSVDGIGTVYLIRAGKNRLGGAPCGQGVPRRAPCP